VTPDCLTCGTCCFSQLENYVRVSGDDHARLGEAAETLVRFDGNRAYMRMEDGHCAALRLEPGDEPEGAGRFVCRIYETRPQVCRDLTQGGLSCRGEIAAKGERPKEAMAALVTLAARHRGT
jgi:Fe-S-cluster containining protein